MKVKVGDTLRITELKKDGYTDFVNLVGKVEKIDTDGTMYGTWGEDSVAVTDVFSAVDFPDETIDSFILKEKLYKQMKDAYGDERRKIETELYKAVKSIVPCKGLPCTICYYSDRRAATVTHIFSKSRIGVTHNQVKCLDYYDGDYEVLPELNEGKVDIFTKRRNGEWVMENQPAKDGVVLMLHYQRHFIDPSF